MDMYCNHHTHTEMSNLRLKDCTNKIAPMIEYVANVLGQKHFTITDHESLSIHLKALNTLKDLQRDGKVAQDFTVGLGNEIYLVAQEELESKLEAKERVEFYHFILIALDNEGHRQLRELSTRAWAKMFNHKGIERVPTYMSDLKEVIGSNKGHVVGTTACLGGQLSKAILKEDYELANEFINWCQDVFGEDYFYLEIQPHKKRNSEEELVEQEIVNTWIKEQGLPTIITTDAHYLKEADRRVHEAFLKSDEDDDMYASGGREVGDFYETTYFMSTDEIKHWLSYLGEDFVDECIANTVKIKDSIKGYTLTKPQAVMEIPLPNKKEWYWNGELVAMMEDLELNNLLFLLDDTNSYNNYLASLCMRGFELRNIPREEWEETLVRLDEEVLNLLGISKAKDTTMSAYFVLMHKFIDIIWEQANSIVGVSRGSAAGWVLNYLLGIVQINPLKQPSEMPLWRFLSSERPDFADIDIDVSSYKRDIVFQKVSEYVDSIGGTIARVGTFKTEGAKSSIQTACRGLGIPSDIGLFLSSMIPVVRGATRSISNTYYGNADDGLEPITEFVNQVNKYEGLLETALGIEGLVSGRSSHACGVVQSLDILSSTSLMKTPNGETITQYDLGDCEQSGLIKFDFLCTKTEGMIQLGLELLVEHGHMEWQGTLRKTYDKYLHPDVLNVDDTEYYKVLNDGELLSAFQFDSMAGVKALKTIQPHSLLEVANANSLMRLMADDGEQPMEMYARYKANPNAWEQDMIDYGLNDKERAIMHKHLDKDFGVCSSQEGMMLMTMDEEIARFNVKESNTIRKGVAKKKPKILQQCKELLYEKGLANGCRQVFLDYVWDVQIAMQRGYSFSILHTTGYSWILIQQLHLVTHYPPIYWNTAVLQLESGAIEQDKEDTDETEGREKTTNYEAIGGAIAMLQKEGIKIATPNINIADTGFSPNEEMNSIVYGLKSVATINNTTAETIIANRPYTSLKDFYERMCLAKQEVTTKDNKKQMKSLITNSQMMNLLQSGAFDGLENKPREEIIMDYLRLTTKPLAKLTKTHIDDLVERNLIGEEYEECLKYHNFREYLKGGVKQQDKVQKSRVWFLLDGEDEEDTDYVVNVFFDMFPELQEDVHWYYDSKTSGIWVATGGSARNSFEGICNARIAPLTRFMNSSECLLAYNESRLQDVKREVLCDSNAQGEMASCCCYFDEHELALIDHSLYNIRNFSELETEPTVEDYWVRKDKETGEETRIPKFRIDRICGTVLGRNKTRHIVTLLTEDGVVNVKFHAGAFSFYDRQLSVVDENGKKRKVESSWFTRGNILMIHGIRREDMFRAKTYKNGLYTHSVYKVTKVYNDGYLTYEEERTQID